MYAVKASLHHLSEKTQTILLNLLAHLAHGTATQSISHVKWSQVPKWINNVLGAHWEVKYGHVTVGNETANAFWHLGNDEGVALMVDVHVESVMAENGVLDVAHSADAVRNRVASILTSTDRDPEKLWVVGESLNEFGSSLQYPNDVPAGRFIIVAANMVIDIRGMSSNDGLQLEDYARKLLAHTVNRNCTPLTPPVILHGPIKTWGNFVGTGMNKIAVEGINNRFSIHFKLQNSIAAAYATPKGTGILFDKYVVEEGPDADVAIIDFIFITREMGNHMVNVHFADSLTMVSVSRMVEIDVV